MEIGRKCPYGEALDKPIKCQRPDGGNEFITHNNNKGHLQHQVERMFYNHVFTISFTQNVLLALSSRRGMCIS